MIDFYTNVNNLDSFAEQDVPDEMRNTNEQCDDEVPNETENV